MITTLLERGGDLVEQADVCVIGTGAGGAVAAAELAAAGRSVVVLEQGHHWTAKDFTQREDEMLPRLFEEGGMRQTADGSVVVLQGRNVGGSTVHNLCYAFRTPDPILKMWREEHGLPELTPEALAPSFARVEQNLKVKPIEEGELNALNRILRAGAQKLGWSGLVAKHNREGCIGAGYCILGCSYDAKQSMLVTYVPRASAAGARIYANARAERIETVGGRARRVLGRVVAHDGTALGSIEVTAKAVVLAAGAVASPDLLLRSGLSNGSGQVGRNLHLHPSVMVAGFFDEPIHAYRGIPQSYYVDQFIDLEKDPHRGFVLMPITGFPVLTAANMPGFGKSLYRDLRDYSKMAAVLALLHDRSAGRVTSGSSPAKPTIEYALTPDDRAQLGEGLVRCAEILLAGGATRVVAPYWIDPIELRPGDDLSVLARRGVREGEIGLASTHPQSTCRMGGDPRSAVLNAFGESHEVPGLFVADMSVFPTSLGAPPQITTAALADRTARHIAARWDELDEEGAIEAGAALARRASGGGPRPGIWQLAWPSMAMFALQSAVHLVDFVIVGSLGTEAVAAVGVAVQFFNVLFAVLAAVTTGTVALVARAIGAGDRDEAERILRVSIALGAVFALGVSCLIPLADQIVAAFGVNAEVVRLGGSYLRIQLCFTLPFAVAFVIGSALRGAGDVRTPLAIGVAMNVVNVIGNYGLVYGALGMPRLGTDGSALASGIAFTTSAALSLWLWRRGTLVLGARPPADGLTRSRARRILRIGLPTALEQGAWQAGLWLFLRLVAHHGTEPVSAYLIGVRILSFSFVPGLAFSTAAATLVGQHLGAGEPELATRSGWRANQLAMIVMAAVGGAIIAAAPWIAGYFGAAGPRTVALTITFIWILGAAQPLMAVEFALGGALRGAGDTRFPLVSILSGLFVFRLGGALLVTHVLHGDVVAVWSCLLADYVVKAVLLAARFRSGRWRHVRV